MYKVIVSDVTREYAGFDQYLFRGTKDEFLKLISALGKVHRERVYDEEVMEYSDEYYAGDYLFVLQELPLKDFISFFK